MAALNSSVVDSAAEVSLSASTVISGDSWRGSPQLKSESGSSSSVSASLTSNDS